MGYVRSVLGPREPVLEEILRRSLTAGMPSIQIDDNAGRMLQMLTRLKRPKHVIEVGTLFGYSTIYIARGLPPEGRITTLEIDPAAADLARQNLEAAGVADRVDIVVGDAVDYLTTVPPASVGMLFIDADKKSYPTYLKHGFPLVEEGGLIIADDAFATGDFTVEVEPGSDDQREINGILSYTRAAGRSPRLLSAFIGTAHGMMISLKEMR
ncbi:MAG TPA: O-methyltransferase [Actinomycetales bacterium]|nr:O-methyltransferase [Actinomycetales bacterium]